MTSRRDHDGGGDRVGIHARLRVVVERDKGPVGDDSRDTLVALEVGADDEIFDCSRVHHHDIRKGQDLGQDSRREERGMLDDHKAALVFIRDADFPEECVRRLTDDLAKGSNNVNIRECACSPWGSSIGRRAKHHHQAQH